ncbi:MAG: hypothetical protein MZU95_04655 [Desulfomicrobium escambiense]|nr:hypothetical protein [Desulfomicrobium escambiense]
MQYTASSFAAPLDRLLPRWSCARDARAGARRSSSRRRPRFDDHDRRTPSSDRVVVPAFAAAARLAARLQLAPARARSSSTCSTSSLALLALLRLDAGVSLMTLASLVHVLLALAARRRCCRRDRQPGEGASSPAAAASRCCSRYRDLAKLLRKGAVYSRTTSWVFRAGPVVGLAAAAGRLAAPAARRALGAARASRATWSCFAYLLGLARFVTVARRPRHRLRVRGHGGEPRGRVLGARRAGAAPRPRGARACAPAALSLRGDARRARAGRAGRPAGRCSLLVARRCSSSLLAENARIPVDDPNTHLELTMIHEVMVLDHGGPDFGLIQYGAGAEALGLRRPARPASLVPLARRRRGRRLRVGARRGHARSWPSAIGVVESVMARLRLVRVPQLLVGRLRCSRRSALAARAEVTTMTRRARHPARPA